ncbi:MAG TPA: hypothetical protein VLA76_02960 [Candidatus Angelobacter sp.]|nr:hypothetical protein [Candidatus Angelobacter sp.]
MIQTRRGRSTRLFVPAIGLALVLAACAPADAPRADCPVEAPSPAPQRPYSQDPELADRIPDEVDGRTLQIETVCATVFDPGGLTTSQAMLDEVGVERRDVTLALSPVPTGGGESSYVGINAWRYAGADEATIREGFLGLLDESGIPVDEETIAGKTVHMAVFHVYYVAGDTLYAVLGEDGPVEAALEGLP